MNLVSRQDAVVVPTMTPEQVGHVQKLEGRLLAMPQVEVVTHHMIHAGIYSRTMRGEKFHLYTGALLKVPTMLIISGDVSIYIGESVVRKVGYHVLIGDVHRKQAFFCHEDTDMTMLFPTKARTVEEAEEECTYECDKLMSRSNPNTVMISEVLT